VVERAHCDGNDDRSHDGHTDRKRANGRERQDSSRDGRGGKICILTGAEQQEDSCETKGIYEARLIQRNLLQIQNRTVGSRTPHCTHIGVGQNSSLYAHRSRPTPCLGRRPPNAPSHPHTSLKQVGFRILGLLGNQPFFYFEPDLYCGPWALGLRCAKTYQESARMTICGLLAK